jgi:hypothetical protein
LLRQPYKRSVDVRPRLITFLRNRLQEEIVASERRPNRSEAGLTMVRDIVRGLRAGRLPSRTVTQMLLVAYADHPEFETRWRDADSVTVSIPDSGGSGDERGPSGVE